MAKWEFREMLQLSALLVVAEALAPFQDHYSYVPVRLSIQSFLSVSAFSIEFLSIV